MVATGLLLYTLGGRLAFAAGPPRGCAGFLETRSVFTTELPSPREVDPEDEGAILRFIDAVTPLPPREQPRALEQTLARFWARYRPDLTDAQIAARLHPYRPTRFAWAALAGESPHRRSDVGRLRLWWMAFVGDVLHDAPEPTAAAVHRAEILLVRWEAGNIVRFLKDESDITTTLDAASVVCALAPLYRRYIPHAAVPPGSSPPDSYVTRNQEIVRAWAEYVNAVRRFRPVYVKSRPHVPLEIRHWVNAAMDPADVPLAARAMIEYLVLRFPSLDPKPPSAIDRHVAALRAEYGLGPSRVVLPPNAFRGVIHGRNKEATRAMFAIWDELGLDRARRGP